VFAPVTEAVDDSFDIELKAEEPRFLVRCCWLPSLAHCDAWLVLSQKGQIVAAAEMTPVKVVLIELRVAQQAGLQVVKLPDGSMERAGKQQSVLAKERK
jgi:hypothetical protein